MPTSKGIRLNSENLKELMMGLADALDVVEIDELTSELQAKNDADDSE